MIILTFCIAVVAYFIGRYRKKKSSDVKWDNLGIKFGRSQELNAYTTSTEMFWYWISPNRKEFAISLGIADINGKFPYKGTDPDWDAIDQNDNEAILNYLVNQYTPWVS